LDFLAGGVFGLAGHWRAVPGEPAERMPPRCPVFMIVLLTPTKRWPGWLLRLSPNCLKTAWHRPGNGCRRDRFVDANKTMAGWLLRLSPNCLEAAWHRLGNGCRWDRFVDANKTMAGLALAPVPQLPENSLALAWQWLSLGSFC
jgi:hypothetical protein